MEQHQDAKHSMQATASDLASHRYPHTGGLKAQLPANPKGRSKDLLWEYLNFLSLVRLKAGGSRNFSWLGCMTKPERFLGREKKVPM